VYGNHLLSYRSEALFSAIMGRKRFLSGVCKAQHHPAVPAPFPNPEPRQFSFPKVQQLNGKQCCFSLDPFPQSCLLAFSFASLTSLLSLVQLPSDSSFTQCLPGHNFFFCQEKHACRFPNPHAELLLHSQLSYQDGSCSDNMLRPQG